MPQDLSRSSTDGRHSQLQRRCAAPLPGTSVQPPPLVNSTRSSLPPPPLFPSSPLLEEPKKDIKGANILVDPNDRVKLADVGLPKHGPSTWCMISGMDLALATGSSRSIFIWKPKTDADPTEETTSHKVKEYVYGSGSWKKSNGKHGNISDDDLDGSSDGKNKKAEKIRFTHTVKGKEKSKA